MSKFLTEILEQPESVITTLNYYMDDEGKQKLKYFSELAKKGNFQRIIFTGMGSSYFVSYAASCFFNSLGFRSYAINASELLHYHFPIINEMSVIVCISQSGESFEAVKLLEKIPKNILSIGISNEMNSSLTEKANEILLSKAGKEEMTTTKTYTSISLLILMLGWNLANRWGKEKINQIIKLKSGIEELLAKRVELTSDILNFLGKFEFIQFIGRGPTFSTALQSELMFKEAVKAAAAGSLGGEFRHGQMEMVNKGFKSILFAAEGQTYNQSINMAMDIVKYQGKIVLITNKKPELFEDKNMKLILIDQPDEYLFSIQSIIPIQLMVNSLALINGLDPGEFIHCGKITLSE